MSVTETPVAFGVPDVFSLKQLYILRTRTDREEIIEELGGTRETEQAVRDALVWLARHQSSDGRWDVDGYMRNYDAKGMRAQGRGGRNDDRRR